MFEALFILLRTNWVIPMITKFGKRIVGLFKKQPTHSTNTTTRAYTTNTTTRSPNYTTNTTTCSTSTTKAKLLNPSITRVDGVVTEQGLHFNLDWVWYSQGESLGTGKFEIHISESSNFLDYSTGWGLGLLTPHRLGMYSSYIAIPKYTNVGKYYFRIRYIDTTTVSTWSAVVANEIGERWTTTTRRPTI